MISGYSQNNGAEDTCNENILASNHSETVVKLKESLNIIGRINEENKEIEAYQNVETYSNDEKGVGEFKEVKIDNCSSLKVEKLVSLTKNGALFENDRVYKEEERNDTEFVRRTSPPWKVESVVKPTIASPP